VSTRTDASIEGSVQVWWGTPAEPNTAVLGLLDDAEQARHLRLQRPDDRAAHATAHALLRLVLGRLLDRPPASIRLDRTCPECGADHGKPRLIGGGLEFSLTHSRGRVGIAVATVPVGIDVEDVSRLRPDPALEAETLTPGERKLLDGLDPADRAAGFLRLWTRKEAMLKASGKGLTVPLREMPADSLAAPAGGPQLWDLDPGPGFVGALAAESAVALSVQQRETDDLLA
jgi:4'-phosphopantetheinyl transferase